MRKKLTAALLAALTALSLCACAQGEGPSVPTWEGQYALGQQYLAEGSFEQAAAALKSAVELDAKRPEGYGALADAYLGAGNDTLAVSALRKGYYATGDEGLRDRLEELGAFRGDPSSSAEPDPAPEETGSPAPESPSVPPDPAPSAPADPAPEDTAPGDARHVVDLACTAAGESAVYTGGWENGMPNGQGSAVFENGDLYEGGWQDGEPYGYGTRERVNGSHTEGEFAGEGWKGQVTIVYRSGAVYTGDTDSAGLKSGLGVYDWGDGTRYDGQWENDRRSGQGVLEWSDGYRYEGAWKDDRECGFGVMTFPDGGRYEGEWDNDKRNGLGSEYDAGGSLIAEGKWEDNVLVQGTKYNADGSIAKYIG